MSHFYRTRASYAHAQPPHALSTPLRACTTRLYTYATPHTHSSRTYMRATPGFPLAHSYCTRTHHAPTRMRHASLYTQVPLPCARAPRTYTHLPHPFHVFTTALHACSTPLQARTASLHACATSYEWLQHETTPLPRCSCIIGLS